MKGILNLYKERGLTSAAAVAKVRRILGEKYVGHFGTLDPQGTGVLLLGVGKAARLFDYFLGKEKVYEADFAFGYTTDTLDGDGEVVGSADVLPQKPDIVAALPALTGQLLQMPPAYSAKSVGGVRAYDVARRGGVPELKAAPVTVHSFELIEGCHGDACQGDGFFDTCHGDGFFDIACEHGNRTGRKLPERPAGHRIPVGVDLQILRGVRVSRSASDPPSPARDDLTGTLPQIGSGGPARASIPTGIFVTVPNPEPRTPNPEPRTPNPEPRIPHHP
ncbi:MAG: tRNA pseudouridine(55) synthase TruB, partial [Firmicutes bacterium]|nr:tRNA pseudouridine(55) synthase TruB [Bacillota bacterium]